MRGRAHARATGGRGDTSHPARGDGSSCADLDLIERAAVVGLALLVDRLGEPPTRIHPVGWLGSLIARLERTSPTDRLGQLFYGAVLVGIPALLAGLANGLLDRLLSACPVVPRLLGRALLLRWTLSLASLERAAAAVGLALDRGAAEQARFAMPALVSRPVGGLSPDQLASAAIESVAENASDSVVAPLFWYGLFGPAAAAFYRAVNTADAMVGYHGRYESLGKASARSDDLMNWLPARLTALAIVLAAPEAGGCARQSWRIARRDAHLTESPNAGWPMAAMAGALGVRLEKLGHYQLAAQYPPPGPRDVRRAIKLLTLASAIACLSACALRAMSISRPKVR